MSPYGVTAQKNMGTCVQLSVLFVLLLVARGGILHAIEHPNEVNRINQEIQAHYSAYREVIRILTNHTKVEADALELYRRLQNHSLSFDPTCKTKNDSAFFCVLIFSFTIVITIGYEHFVPATFGRQMLEPSS